MSGQGQDDGQEKSHDPTPSRLEQARRDGDVPQSKEVNATASYLGLFFAIIAASSGVVIKLADLLTSFHREPEAIQKLAVEAGDAFISKVAVSVFAASGLFLLLPGIGVMISILGQRAFSFSTDKVKPKLSRLSIASNAKKKFGPDGIAEFIKSSTKLILIIGVFIFIFLGKFSTLPAEAVRPAIAVPSAIWREAILFVGLIVLFSTAVAAVDLPWTQFQYRKRLRMTYEELKKESKENEGDPALKQDRRKRAQAIATNKMMRDVPKADVVLVNPTHYAVALSWERGKLGAPICVAKGVDEIAAKIREIASSSGVPIKRDPPTARAIHATVEIGDEIKREQYAAVAAALHFADAIRAKAREQSWKNSQWTRT